MLFSGFWMWAMTFGLAGAEMSHVCAWLMHAAPAILRGRKTLTSWQPMFGETSAVPMTFALCRVAVGISTIEIFRGDATVHFFWGRLSVCCRLGPTQGIGEDVRDQAAVLGVGHERVRVRAAVGLDRRELHR